ncbi:MULTISPECIES: hypothetical protein [unclassified Paenibacillus]|uniref:hypothetical protein n=1 Tax=unclassified Paenibacillus TaxID=185978 RepID=UPI001AE13AA5|nr:MULTISPECIES: hypothetical protein [unclassified Paenibacillus]MBP1153297.1 hypothetical protein [Paenibacillus sp. PvP091]MBP1171320.1 hypothetical protein [Paenibacillus sp. PvR098]MBP2442348.1 hypothetical protein [Paenibacillus sp. PvP052]
MRLFYPTTSLNFNDMLATESISPKSFYDIRGFGTKRHFETEMSISPDYLTFFSTPPRFKLISNQESEYDEYPIILELELTDCEHYHRINDEIYIYPKTVYFDEKTVKFRFFDELHVKKVLAKSKIVEEVKTVHKYRNNFILITENILKEYIIDNLEVDPSNIEVVRKQVANDRLYNKIKGLLYAFLYKYYSSLEDSDVNELVEYIDKAISLAHKLPFPYSNFIEDGLKLVGKYVWSAPKIHNYDFSLIRHLTNNRTIEFNHIEVISAIELKIYESITNRLIDKGNNLELELKKEDLINIRMIVQENAPDLMAQYNADINIINERLFNRNYQVDINSINSLVLKSFLLFLLKNRNIEELELLISQHGLRYNFLIYGFIGTSSGFSGLSRIITNELYRNEQLVEVIDKQLAEIRALICDRFPVSYINNKSPNIEEDLYNGDLFTVDDNSLDSYDESKITKGLIDQIQRIRQSKVLNSFLKVKDITLENTIKVNFSNEANNVLIRLIDNDTTVYLVTLKSIGNVKKDELTKFKNYLVKLGYNKSVSQGKFPVFYFSKSDKSELTIAEKKNLLSSLNLLI